MYSRLSASTQASDFLKWFLSRFFSSFRERDFARGGMNAEDDIVIPAGPLPFQHTMVEQLRKLGLPVMLKNGGLNISLIITLQSCFIVISYRNLQE